MDWISALGKGFERLLRWAYPGVLFLVLLYMSKPTVFKAVSEAVGFPDDTFWGLLIGGLGIGFALYLFQAYCITSLFSVFTHWFEYDPNLPNVNKDRYSNCRFVKWFSDEAEKIENLHPKRENLQDYMNYSWGTFHAAFLTGLLTIIFTFIPNSMLGYLPFALAVLLLIGALYLFLILSRVNRCQD